MTDSYAMRACLSRRGELLKEQLLWPGQALTLGRQPRDNTFTLPCPDAPWRVQVLSPHEDGWRAHPTSDVRVRRLTAEAALPLVEGSLVSPEDVIEVAWQELRITLGPQRVSALPPEVPAASRPLRLRPPSLTLCGVMVALAMIQIGSVATLRGHASPWTSLGMTWRNTHLSAPGPTAQGPATQRTTPHTTTPQMTTPGVSASRSASSSPAEPGHHAPGASGAPGSSGLSGSSGLAAEAPASDAAAPSLLVTAGALGRPQAQTLRCRRASSLDR